MYSFEGGIWNEVREIIIFGKIPKEIWEMSYTQFSNLINIIFQNKKEISIINLQQKKLSEEIQILGLMCNKHIKIKDWSICQVDINLKSQKYKYKGLIYKLKKIYCFKIGHWIYI